MVGAKMVGGSVWLHIVYAMVCNLPFGLLFWRDVLYATIQSNIHF